MKTIVNIKLKSGVLDPAGKAVEHALTSLGYSGIENVRIGKQIVLDVDEKITKDTMKEMCEKLLANTVIEEYDIVLQEDSCNKKAVE